MAMEMPPRAGVINKITVGNWNDKRCDGCGSTELKGCNCAHCGSVRFIEGPKSVYIKC